MTCSKITSSKTSKPRQQNVQIVKKPKQRSWFERINDDRTKLAIPVGPRFQADIPEWTGSPSNGDEPDTAKWLGIQVWSIKGRTSETWKDTNENKILDGKSEVIGRGRPDFCPCKSPGSVECVKRHVINKRIQLQYDLGPAFWRWKFNEMGEEASNLWDLEEQKMFDSIVKENPVSEGKSFLKPALKCFRSRSRRSIVNYYFSVYLPRRIAKQTRSGCTTIDTDDEEDEEAPAPDSRVKGSRKRCQSETSDSSKHINTRSLRRLRQ